MPGVILRWWWQKYEPKHEVTVGAEKDEESPEDEVTCSGGVTIQPIGAGLG